MSTMRLLILLFLASLGNAHVLYDDEWATDNDGYHMYHMQSQGQGDKVDSFDFTNPPEDHAYDWWQIGQTEIERAKQVAASTITKPAKNVILFVGDGMGVSTITAARILRAQTEQLMQKDLPLSFERLPHVGLSMTYASDQIVPDSANTATAMLTGHKCRDSVLGATVKVIYKNCSSLHGNEVPSILEHSIDEGKWTGVVTNTRITHATPAAAYAKSASRNFETDLELENTCIGDDCGACDDIAHQLVYGHYANQIRVIMGGGRSKFMTINETDPEYPERVGDRGDENLFEAWKLQKHEMGVEGDKAHIVFNKEQFDAVDETTAEYIFGNFEPGHMKYVVDKSPEDEWDEPSLAEMVQKSVNMLKRSGDKGYFLLVEGGRIDHAHHDTNAHRSLQETIALHEAVEMAMNITDEDDTMIVVTADHSHVFTIAGYGMNNAHILTYDDNLKPQMGGDNKPYTTLSYANGPGWYDHRTDDDGNEQPRLNLSTLTMDALKDKNFRQDATVPLNSETHSGEDVGIYARGPMAHLFHGVHEQNYIAHLMMYASCVGPNKQLCETSPPTTPIPTISGASISGPSSMLALLLPALIMLLRRVAQL